MIPVALLTAMLATHPMTGHANAESGREVRIDQQRFDRLAPSEQARVLEIKERLEAIMAMDRDAITREQRREMRGEWKDLKSEMKELNRGGTVIYISGLGLLLIIILLIILL